MMPDLAKRLLIHGEITSSEPGAHMPALKVVFNDTVNGRGVYFTTDNEKVYYMGTDDINYLKSYTPGSWSIFTDDPVPEIRHIRCQQVPELELFRLANNAYGEDGGLRYCDTWSMRVYRDFNDRFTKQGKFTNK